MNRTPYTLEELETILPVLEERLAETEEENPDAQPLPPMTAGECMEFFKRLLDYAGERPLTKQECFIFGQLLAQFRQATMAEVLGKKGRYYCISENQIAELVERG